MRRDIERLKTGHFDILVIGGGINGCAISRDAALRGAKVALIEKEDFASGASGKTTKLIHGGLRYLEQFNFRLVAESLGERAILLRQAPHLVKPLEFIIPVYKDDPRSLLKIKTGVFIYDLLAAGNNIRPHRSLKKYEVLSLEQNINPLNLEGGVLYSDAQMDDIRLCLDNAISAYNAGAVLANKVEAVGFIKEKGRIAGIEAQDKLSGEEFFIRSSIVINATGAWSNRIVKLDGFGYRKPNHCPLACGFGYRKPNHRPLADESASLDITRPTKGIHIVYRRLPHQRAILLSARKDKRILFIIPWRGYSLIGTTDTDYTGSPDEVYASSQEVEYLLEETRRVFPDENIDKKNIITTYASLRPLVNPHTKVFGVGVNTQRKSAWQVSREHFINESRSGLISVVGGKYTTYRHLAEQVVDLALSRIKGRNFKEYITRMALAIGSQTIVPQLMVGPSSPALAQEKADLPKRIEQAVKEEMANSLIDLLVRRLQLSITPAHGLEYLQECADIMAALLGWTDTKKEEEISLYKEEVRKNMNF